MSIHVNDAGTLREITEAYVNDNGTLRELESIEVNDAGTLRSFPFSTPVVGSFTFEKLEKTDTTYYNHGGVTYINISGRWTEYLYAVEYTEVAQDPRAYGTFSTPNNAPIIKLPEFVKINSITTMETDGVWTANMILEWSSSPVPYFTPHPVTHLELTGVFANSPNPQTVTQQVGTTPTSGGNVYFPSAGNINGNEAQNVRVDLPAEYVDGNTYTIEFFYL